MLYSILKDDEPKNTVEKIKKILKTLNINLEENFYVDNDCNAPISLRLNIKNNWHLGTNGKGTSKENALASAYAEFIERLQNLFLFDDYNDVVYLVPDKIKVDKTVNFANKNLEKYFNKKLLIHKKLKKNNEFYDENYLFPFFSIKEQKIYNIPYNILVRTKGSNGMAAGNTLEEALVQGLSEVCERYALKKIIEEELLLKEIPKESYLKYENIKKMILYYENNGFKIHIKDATLNGKVPVVCTIIEDIKNNIFCPSFGSHPSFPIAIERTLTEFAQGMMLSKFRKYNFIGYSFYSKEKLKYTSKQNIYKALFMHKVAFEKIPKYEKQFFDNNIVSVMPDDTFILENKKYNNKELLSFLTNRILKFSDDIYIRDVSFLGFPSVDIFIPNITDIAEYNEKNIKNRMLDIYWSVYHKNSDKESYNIYSLLKLAELFSFTDTLTSSKVFQVPFEYIALLCSLVLKDSRKIIKYIDVILGQNRIQENYEENQILTFKIIKDFYNKKELHKKYKKADIDYALDVINNLTFDDVLNISIKKQKIKTLKMKMLFQKLERLYKKNMPNQISLGNIFRELNKYAS